MEDVLVVVSYGTVVVLTLLSLLEGWLAIKDKIKSFMAKESLDRITLFK